MFFACVKSHSWPFARAIHRSAVVPLTKGQSFGQRVHTLPWHDDVIKWKHFPRYWPFVRGIHRSPVNTLPKGQWRGPFRFSLICAWINGWVNNREAGDLRRHRTDYDVIVMEAVMSLGWPGLAGRYRWWFLQMIYSNRPVLWLICAVWKTQCTKFGNFIWQGATKWANSMLKFML